MAHGRHPKEEDGVDDSDGNGTGEPFGVPPFQGDAADPLVLWQEVMATTSSAASGQEAMTGSSWYTDRADTETATEAPSLTAHMPGDMPGEMGNISDMHEQPPSPPPPPPWPGVTPPAAPKTPGYAGSAGRSWQSRITTAERRPGLARSNARQAHLTLARVEPWSVLKFSFVASVVAFVILFVAVIVLYLILAGMGVFDSLQSTTSTITSSQGTAGTNISDWFSASTVLGYTGMLGALNIVLIPALCTVGAVIYNYIAEYFGGVEVTLRESD